MREMVKFDRATTERLRKAYTAAVEAKLEVFNFDGRDLYVPYAKYLIEYLDNVLAPQA